MILMWLIGISSNAKKEKTTVSLMKLKQKNTYPRFILRSTLSSKNYRTKSMEKLLCKQNQNFNSSFNLTKYSDLSGNTSLERIQSFQEKAIYISLIFGKLKNTIFTTLEQQSHSHTIFQNHQNFLLMEHLHLVFMIIKLLMKGHAMG